MEIAEGERQHDSSNRASALQPWTVRNGFADWAMALLWIVLAFLLFQLTAGVVGFGLIAATESIPQDPQAILDLFSEHLDLVFIGNSIGQVLFLGLATWGIARLHTTRAGHSSFLRFKTHSDTGYLLLFTGVLIVVAQPVIWFLGWINAQIPVPEFFSNLQNSQMDLIQNLLNGEYSMVLVLFHVGLVPAICEEVLYRGYVMRAFEKSWGIWAAMVASGLLFGLYHVQLTNLLPLASIGMLLAFVTWVSDSIYPAMLAHLINNGGSVLVGTYYPDSTVAEITPETMPPIWALLVGGTLTVYFIYLMYQHMNQTRKEGSHV